MPIVETDPELRFRRHFPTIAGPVSSVARKRLFASLPARGGRGTGDMEGGMPHANGPALLAARSITGIESVWVGHKLPSDACEPLQYEKLSIKNYDRIDSFPAQIQHWCLMSECGSKTSVLELVKRALCNRLFICGQYKK